MGNPFYPSFPRDTSSPASPRPPSRMRRWAQLRWRTSTRIYRARNMWRKCRNPDEVLTSGEFCLLVVLVLGPLCALVLGAQALLAPRHEALRTKSATSTSLASSSAQATPLVVFDTLVPCQATLRVINPEWRDLIVTVRRDGQSTVYLAKGHSAMMLDISRARQLEVGVSGQLPASFTAPNQGCPQLDRQPILGQPTYEPLTLGQGIGTVPHSTGTNGPP